MKKNRMRHGRMLAAMLLSLLLAACGSSTSQTTQAPTSGAPAATAATAMPEATAASGGAADGKTYTVGIVQQTTHPALDAATKGTTEAFAQSGLNVTVDAKNAQNDPATLASITDGFRDAKVDLVVAVGTQPVQAAFKSLQGSGIPIIFNTVTDPYAAGVAKSESEHPGITGIQALPPVAEAFDLILLFKPDAKKVGNIWTSNEKNSEVATGIARKYAESKGIQLVERQVTRADEVLQAAESLAADKVDAIFISTDSTVVSTLESVVKVANENDIGLFCNDPASAARGCVTGLGLDYYDNGFQSVKEMGIAVLQGTKADTIPIKKQEKKSIALNTAAAREQGLTIPADVQSMATQVLDTITPK
jgi:putative tryptophan/tyrosine transport system substrate-binding protein